MSRTAVVTGASRGIGHGVCRELADRGWSVVAVARRAADAADSGGDPLGLSTDVTDESQVATLARTVEARFGAIDLLVNAAGVMPPTTVTATTTRQVWDDTLAVNVTAPFLLSRAFQPLLVRNPGSAVINVTGGFGTFASGMAGGGQPAYRVSKAALNALTLTLAEELKEHDVRVLAFDPGWVRTDMGGPDAPRSVAEVAAELVDTAEKSVLSGVLVRGGEAQPW